MVSEAFGSHLDPNWGSSWAPLGTPRGPKMQYVVRPFDVFVYSLLCTYDVQDDPKSVSRGPEEALKRLQEEVKEEFFS